MMAFHSRLSPPIFASDDVFGDAAGFTPGSIGVGLGGHPHHPTDTDRRPQTPEIVITTLRDSTMLTMLYRAGL